MKAIHPFPAVQGAIEDSMTHGSLFSGIGGFDLAAEWMGWKNEFHCEINPFGRQILNYYWPQAKSYEDITKTDFTIWRGRIDILTGGFPCQPFSLAGKRKGTEDDRHLWPEMLRAIREIQPRWIVGENVFGLVNWDGGMVFEQVQADLEAQGYEVQPFILPAASVNAPHRRDRIWFVAKNTNNDGRGGNEWEEESSLWEQRNISTRNNERVCSNNGEIRTSTNSKSQQGERMQFEQREISQQEQRQSGGDCSGLGNGNTSNTSIEQLQGGLINRGFESKGAVQNNCGQLSRSVCSTWEKFPTQSPVCDGDDGLSARLDGITFSKWRNESIKGGGNAIVPQVVLQIFKAIEEYERRKSA